MKEAKKLSWEDFLKLKKHSPLYKFTVVTGSMAPLIPVGGEIVVDTVTTPKLGDIVVFWQEGLLICHILWHKNARLTDARGVSVLSTRPLDSHHWDLSIRSEQMLGRVLNYQVPRWRLWLLKWRDWRRRG
jgi:hypothetical protein